MEFIAEHAARIIEALLLAFYILAAVRVKQIINGRI